MKKIFPRLSVFVLLVVFAIQARSQCLTGWQYNLPVAVMNNTFSSITDYQVKLTINTAKPIAASKMISTGDDIRFTDAGSCTLLNYWIESGINTQNTVIWIKMPVLPASSTRNIMMYYGNASAPAMSNGDSTFVFFDDFTGTSLNSSKWITTLTGSNPSVSVANGQLKCSTTAEANIRSTATFASPITLEANMTAISGSWESLAILNDNTNDGYAMWQGDVSTSTTTMYMGDAFTPANPACHNYTTHSRNSNTNPGTVTGIWTLSWPATNVQSAKWPGGSYTNSYTYVTQQSKVQVAVGNMCGATGSMSVDWIRARTYAAFDAFTTPGNEHSTGIDNAATVYHVDIYPNPAHNVFNIDLREAAGSFETIEVMDINGRSLQQIAVESSMGNVTVPVAGFSPGMYFIKMVGTRSILLQKVVLE